MTADKDIYRTIADEIASMKTDAALWTKATALAEGDPGKTQAAYIRLRFEDLRKIAQLQAAPPGQNGSNAAASPTADEGLHRMRSELGRKVQARGKSSLYEVLGLQPDASDAAVAVAIAELEAKDLTDPAITAELKYARTILGNPESREQYDRKLMNDILNSEHGLVRSYMHEARHKEMPWWSARNTSTVIGILFLATLGYWALDYFRVINVHEIQKSEVAVKSDAVDIQREAVLSTADIERQRILSESEMRQRAMALSEASQRQAMDYQRQTQERMQMEQEKRLALAQERERLQQQQMENINAQKEKQYWICINQQLDVRGVTTSDAYTRCAMYRR